MESIDYDYLHLNWYNKKPSNKPHYMKRAAIIAQASKEFYDKLKNARVKIRHNKKSTKHDYAPVPLKKRKLVLRTICSEYSINFDFMCKMLRVNENTGDIQRFMQ